MKRNLNNEDSNAIYTFTKVAFGLLIVGIALFFVAIHL